ncbi:MAG: (2Fe-2S)-binding protein [Deltaproteobacteria bacterium]|nr:(2Fe-2S)-binding protein [Deltaproteobacteria bacterium]
MAKRITNQITRSALVMLTLNNQQISAFEGETLATVILLSGEPGCKLGKADNPRGPFCNMGVCYDCLVTVIDPASPDKRLKSRACMTMVKAGLRVFTTQEDSI